ncbi:MAG: SOS response-associated peptidase [Micromonosporaceae bacterium]|nr:SOS response-associated peptidase [Micromonosporaceae bacterium]
MCGRYATTRSAADLSALFDAVDETAVDEMDLLEPRYNVAPTDPVPVVRTDRSGQRVLVRARWGLLPHWARDPKAGARMINARVETVATAPAYARPFVSRRALVPADGWYEWRRLPGGGKQAYFMTPADGSILTLAGLWSRWGPDGKAGHRLLTFTVLTTAAIGELAAIHDRMPLLLPPQRWARWLSGDPALDPPPPAFLAGLELRPVAAAVGNVRNDRPELVTRVDIERVADQPAPTLF